jgi:glycosyltransferase involved in cell wall biosynthesis
MKTPVTVSATTAVYNQRDTIVQALESVVALGDLIEEYVLLDDCSTDGTLKILEDYAARYPVIRLLRNEKNMGAVYSFRHVFSEAKGNYVLGVAGDDYFLPGLRQLIEFAQANPGCGLYCGDIDISYEDEHRMLHDHFGFAEHPVIIPPDKLGPAVKGKYIPSAGMLIKRDLIIGESAYRQELKWIADWFVNQDIAFTHGIGYIPVSTCVLRYYNSNFSSQCRDWKKQKPVLWLLFKLLHSEQYALLYRQMTKYKMFNALQGGVPRLLIGSPFFWDRYTVKIIFNTITHLLYLKLCAIIPANIKIQLKHWLGRAL